MARLSELGLPTTAVEQQHIQLLLQVLDLQADRRLGHIEAIGSLLEATLVGNSAQDAELIEGEGQIRHQWALTPG